MDGNTGNPSPKFVAPQAGRVYRRSRLFKALDRLKARPLAWLTAPAGSGKTTLVVDYLEARDQPCLWYQLDAGDGDVASFFYHLRQSAAHLVPRLAKELPLLTPEYLQGLDTFSRNFFHALFGALPRPLALVFDNYQDVPVDAPLHRLLAQALDTLPPGLRMFVASREMPPDDYARLRLAGRAHLLTWEDFRLTEAESAAVARMRLGKSACDRQLTTTLHERSGGWLAGLILLLEHAPAGDAPMEAGVPGTPLMFGYFAAEVMRDQEPELVDFLLRTAILPRPDSRLADRLLERNDSGHLFAQLVERQLFTTRLTGVDGGYSYHPLFQAFLLDRLEQTLSRDELDALRKRAADLLAASAEYEDAVALYQSTNDWQALAELLIAHASEIFAQGRHQQLARWLALLPDESANVIPWVGYWRAMCVLPLSPFEARRGFESSYAGFRKIDDPLGQYLAWAGIADSFLYAWDDFTPALPWLDVFDDLQSRHPELPPPADAPVTSAALGLLLHARPEDPQIHRWAEHAGQLLPTITQSAPKNALGHILGQYHSWLTTDQYQMRVVAAELARVDDSGALGPLAAICARIFEGHLHSFTGDVATALERLESAHTLAHETGILIFDSLLAAQLVYVHVYSGNLPAAEAQLTAMNADDSPRRLDRGHYHYLAGWVAWLRGDMADAWHHAQAAHLTYELHVPFTEQVSRIVMAQLSRSRGENEQAAHHLQRARTLAEAMGSNIGLFGVRCTEAWFALLDGRPRDALEPLRRAFAWGAASGTLVHPWWRPDIMALLCAAALEHDIETDYARRLIRFHRFQPPTGTAPDAWSWPLRIHALGPLRVSIDDEPLQFGPKAPKKPLELLRRLLVEGGRDLDVVQLAEDLWPDADGDLAHHNLETTLYRLRKLLRLDGVLRLEEGRLGIARDQCWVDLRELEAVLNTLDAARRNEAAASAVTRVAERLSALYRGPLLEGVEDAWVIAARERLHARVARAAAMLKERWGIEGPSMS